MTTTKPAHETVTVRQAAKLYRRDGIDWPVSGDESKRAHGYVGLRRAGKRSIWTGVELNSILDELDSLDPGDTLDCHGCVDPVNHPHVFGCDNA